MAAVCIDEKCVLNKLSVRTAGITPDEFLRVVLTTNTKFQVGDRVRTVGDIPVTTLRDLYLALSICEGQTPVVVERNGCMIIVDDAIGNARVLETHRRRACSTVVPIDVWKVVATVAVVTATTATFIFPSMRKLAPVAVAATAGSIAYSLVPPEDTCIGCGGADHRTAECPTRQTPT
jgi:hypothetical protein